MSKKKKTNGNHNKKFSNLRKMLKAAEGLMVTPETIYLDGNLRSDDPPRITCTCGWSSERSANLLELGRMAKKHELENPGHFRRQH